MTDEDDYDFDGGQQSYEADVADWGNLKPEERKRLLTLPLTELARLVGRHPELGVFLRAGIEAVRSAEAQERSAHVNAYGSYNAHSAEFIKRLIGRLSEEGVTEAEVSRIYDLLGEQQKGDQRVTSEIIRAHDRTGTKVLIAVGGLAAIGLAAYYLKGRGSLPATLPPSTH